MKRIFAVLLCLTMLFVAFPFVASAYDNTVSVSITDYDSSPGAYGVSLFRNTGSSTKIIYVANYSFRDAKLLIFNSNGKLIEAGNGLFANSSTVTGSPQSTVKIPAGGFMVVFGNSASTTLNNVYNTALEGAVIYNATMSTIYDIYGTYSSSSGKLTISYNTPKAPSANAKKFMFIGNSSTYFNGTPIKFKGLAQAAGVEIDVDYCTFGSAMLWEFASSTHERGQTMRNMLANNEYDYVVIQGEASANYYKVKDYVHTIVSEINKNGAEPLLYMRYSAASTLEQNTINAKKHYDTYTALATEYDLRVSPAADAFIFCHAKYPSITLYAEDGGHHSKEGSYLIGCVWLYSYLGIDPVGNTYTADMDATTVARLQECAKLAVDQGYPYPGRYNTYTANGTTYQNIALGKSYVSSGAPYNNATLTDTGSDGKPLGKLTDGKFATLGNDKTIGAYNGNDVNIDIDLKAYSDIKAVKTTLFGNTSWGLPDPYTATVNVAVSNDGINYTTLGTASKSNKAENNSWIQTDFTFAAPANTKARYVRFNIKNMVCTWTSELSVYGVLGTPIVDTDPDFEEKENIALNKSYTISGSGENYAPYTAKLTDGVAYTGIAYDDKWFTFYNNGDDPDKINAPDGVGAITVDLGENYSLTKIMINAIDLKGDSGIKQAKSMKAYFSTDGTTWSSPVALKIPQSTQSGVAYLVQSEVSAVARYVKIEVELDGIFAFLNEIKMNGTKGDTPVNPDPDPNEIKNVALNKEYEATALDTTYTAKLTDGVAAQNLTYDNNWFVFKNNPASEQPLGGGNAPNRVGTVVIDLEDKFDISQVRINAVQNDTSGINVPSKVTVYLSEDGNNWDKGQTLDIPDASSLPVNTAFQLVGDVTGKARFVKIEIALGAKSFVFFNEIEVYGVESAESDPDPDPEYTLGDVNADGAINQYDYILVKRHYFGTRILNDAEMKPADVNNDKKVDQYDYILICRHYFGTYKIG